MAFAADTLTLALARHDSRLTDPAFAGSAAAAALWRALVSVRGKPCTWPRRRLGEVGFRPAMGVVKRLDRVAARFSLLEGTWVGSA